MSYHRMESKIETVVRLSAPLIRNLKWEIRIGLCPNSITSAQVKSLTRSIQTCEDLRSNYNQLKDFLRNELRFPRRKEDTDTACNKKVRTKHGSPFDSIRHIPEIMLYVYSYLSLGDRVYRMSLVDSAFSRDRLRGGIVCATYGQGINLQQAVLELRRWADRRDRNALSLENCNASDKCDNGCKESSTGERRDARPLLGIFNSWSNLMGFESLLFVKSNLRNNLVAPRDRKKWMELHLRRFCGEIHDRQEQTWMDDVIFVETFLRRYFYDDDIGTLQAVLKASELSALYSDYGRSQRESYNRVDAEGRFIWRLPDISPGCTFHLLSPDGWVEHRFASCGGCSCIHRLRKGTQVSCRHGHERSFCRLCRSKTSTKDITKNETFQRIICKQCAAVPSQNEQSS